MAHRFDRDFPKMPGDWLFKVVPVFIAIFFVAVIGGLIVAGIYGVKAAKALDGCTPAVVTSEKDGQKQTSIECKK